MENKDKITAIWSLEGDEAVNLLNSSHDGLTEEEAQTRFAKYGPNTFAKKKPPSALLILLKQFSSPLIFILLAAAVFTAILKEWDDTAFIIFSILVNTGLGFYQEYRAENTIDKLITYIKDRARVIRGGREQEIDSTLLVPGDIVKLSYGSRIPADMRIITLNGLRADEAILTGESLPISKQIASVSEGAVVADRKNMAFAGTLVVEGYATAVVSATGEDTELGKIAKLVSQTKREATPIQKAIQKVAWLIFSVLIIIVAGIFFLGIYNGEPVLEMLVLSAAVAVGAVPEALPIALTVILAIGALRIAKNKGVIRTLSAAETLGSATLIMTDKTGTLTQADMRLVSVQSKQDIIDNTKTDTIAHLSVEQKAILILAARCVDVVIENPEEAKEEWKFKGSPFEVNIARATRDHKLIDDSFAFNNIPLIPFNSSNKFSVSKIDKHFVVLGAPDILLSRSKINKDDFLAIQAKINTVSSEGRRLLGIAHLPASVGEKIMSGHFDLKEIENLEFLGVMTFYDPIRPEVPAVIKKIESYGVKLVMVTGDLKGTAMAVAKELGWDVHEGEVISGEDLRSISDEELSANLSHLKIFARVTPEDKLRIGSLFRKKGEIVAMTGDGVNDAPSLKAMDIGIAIGSGSDVAKSAADIVLLDDNFQTIALAVVEGRRILANIRKAFVYLMSNSFDEVFLISGSLVFGLPMPLTALQIIWVNLSTGSLPALAFAFDDDYDGEHAGAHSLRELINSQVKTLVFGIGVVTSALLFVLYQQLLSAGIPLDESRAILFVCFATYILAIAFSFRSLHRPLFSYPLFSNRKLNIGILISGALLIATMSVPMLRNLFELVPIPLSHWWIVAFWLVLNIAVIELAKFFFRFSLKRR